MSAPLLKGFLFVLVTGVARTLGAQVARRLAVRPGVETVVGVDVDEAAADLRPARFGRVDLLGPDLRRLLAVLQPEVIVHTQVAGRGRVRLCDDGSRSR